MKPELANITLETLESLRIALPTDEDRKALATYSGSPDKLAPSDRFIYEMAKLPRCMNKLDCLTLKMTLDTRIDDIRRRMSLISEACKQLRESKKFHTLLECILMLGNTLNVQNEEANRMTMTHAVQLDSLSSLSNTKGFDKKTSLLIFLEKLLALKYPEVFDLQEELSDLPLASRESFVDIQQDEESLNKQLNSLTGELQSIEKESKEAKDEEKKELEESAQQLSDFASAAQGKIVAIRNEVEKVKEVYADFLQYFCQDRELKSDEFFSGLCAFLDELRVIHTRMQEQRERMQRKKEKEITEKVQKHESQNSSS